VYFNAVLLLRAVARAAPYLEQYDIAVAPASRAAESDRTKELRIGDEEAKQSLTDVINLASGDGVTRGFDEADFFNGADSKVRSVIAALTCRCSKSNSSTTSEMCRVLWTASVAISVGCGGSYRSRAWALR
jgi:hypothetical protein